MPRRRNKTIHCVRHGESEHNVMPWNSKLKDPYLTAAGILQAQCLGTQFPYLDRIDLIVCSPMKRTLQTALLAFEDHLNERKQEIIALPELQELGGKPCDTGSSLAELLTEFREDRVNFDLVPHDWESKDRQWAPTEQRTLARMNRLRSWLRDRPEENILIISHAYCLQLLTRVDSNNLGNDRFQEVLLGLLPPWKNCEWRTFVAEEDEKSVLLFVETKTSKRVRVKQENIPILHKIGEDVVVVRPSSAKTGSRPQSGKWRFKRTSTASSKASSPDGTPEKNRHSPSPRSSLKDVRKFFTPIGR